MSCSNPYGGKCNTVFCVVNLSNWSRSRRVKAANLDRLIKTGQPRRQIRIRLDPECKPSSFTSAVR